MEMTHSGVGESNYNIQEYVENDSVSNECKKKISSVDFLILPYKYEKNFYFSQEAVSFLKYCRNLDNEHSWDILADDNIEIRALHSFDIWMPIIQVASLVLLPISLNLVSNYIWDRMKGRENENCQVDVTFKIQDGEKVKELHYKGDATSFKDRFEKIDINNL